MNKPFCVFIISHGRPDKVVTLRTLKRCDYTGPLFIVCDNEDKTVDQYRKNHGAGMVLVFDKLHYASLVDSCDNFQNRRTTTHARNACFDLAKERGFHYFLVLDDDYTAFEHTFDRDGNGSDALVLGFDRVCASVFGFMESDARIKSVCFMQGGEIIGGLKKIDKTNRCAARRGIYPFIKRKAMNSFFCNTSRRFWFFSRLNEDVNMYLRNGSMGDLFLTIPDVHLNQIQSQGNSGGMSEAYLASGTYVKSFYSVMTFPSACKVTANKDLHRLHHKISWNNTVPKILDDAHKKP